MSSADACARLLQLKHETGASAQVREDEPDIISLWYAQQDGTVTQRRKSILFIFTGNGLFFPFLNCDGNNISTRQNNKSYKAISRRRQQNHAERVWNAVKEQQD